MQMVEFITTERAGFVNEGEDRSVWINPAHAVKVVQQDAGTRNRTVIYHDLPASGDGYTVVNGTAADIAARLSAAM